MVILDANYDYFMWLCELVDAEDPDNGYINLMGELYSTEFSDYTAKLVPNDDNRIADGISLRDKFLNESIEVYPKRQVEDLLDMECTLLEMLIALAYRMEYSFGYKDGIAWFWEILDNLGVMKFNDRFYENHPKGWDILVSQIGTFLSRRYDFDGKGGLFPLKEPERDQRRVEIWYQMNNYLVENYMD